MRLLIAIAALALPVSAGSAERVRTPPAKIGDVPMRPCENPHLQQADEDAKGEPKRLGELPPGNLVLTVMRGTGNCYRPVIVRRGIGAGGEQLEHSVTVATERRRKPKLIR